jgi:hypothetical protein
MEQKTVIQPFQRIDWRWVGIAYCFFVVFHLMPLYVLTGISEVDIGRSMPPMWLFVGLFVISYYVGYRSPGVTIAEPTIASVLYNLTLLMEFGSFRSAIPKVSFLAQAFVWFVFTTAITIVGAWFGEIMQARKARKSGSAV